MPNPISCEMCHAAIRSEREAFGPFWFPQCAACWFGYSDVAVEEKRIEDIWKDYHKEQSNQADELTEAAK
jgi:hypothetical protein